MIKLVQKKYHQYSAICYYFRMHHTSNIYLLGCLYNPQMVWRDNSNSDLYIVLSDKSHSGGQTNRMAFWYAHCSNGGDILSGILYNDWLYRSVGQPRIFYYRNI